MSDGKSSPGVSSAVLFIATLVAAALFAPPASAAFHLWTIQEVYSNSSGTLQFIEMKDGPPLDSFGFQNFVNGSQIFVSNVGGTQVHSFTVPGNQLPGNTLDHMLLFGTAGVPAAGGPTPDYLLPDNFLFTGGGVISFFGSNSGAYGTLPTDGHLSLDWVNGTTSLNSPTNFTGDTGTISPVPEPSTACLLSLVAGVGWYRRIRRRRTDGAAAQPDPRARPLG